MTTTFGGPAGDPFGERFGEPLGEQVGEQAGGPLSEQVGGQGAHAGPAEVRITRLTAAHWDHVHAIYASGIASGHATFAEEPPTWDAFDREKLPILRRVAVGDGGAVLGWSACSPTSRRLVYVGVLEVSLYVDPGARGRGIGSLLMADLVEESEDAGFWTLQSAVFPENTASLALHRAHGFRTVGVRERIGKMTHGPMAGVWRDTVLLERRSTRVG